MKVAGVVIKRHQVISSSYVTDRIVYLQKGGGRVILLHELGHCFAPADAEWLYLGSLLSGTVPRELLELEATAWRWAYKTATQRGKPFSQEEIELVRHYYGTYIRGRRSLGRARPRTQN